MRVIYMTDTGSSAVYLADDSQFIMNEPNGFVRIIEKTPDGLRNWYFNLQHLVALGPNKESI